MPAGLEHGRVSVDRLQILRLPRGNQEDYAPGDFEYTVHMIVEIRFQKFHCFFVQVAQVMIRVRPHESNRKA